MAEVDEGLLASLSALSRLLQPPADEYTRLANLAHRAVTGCDHASVSLVGDAGAVVTAGTSDDRTGRLDQAQYASGEGPCLTAIHGGAAIKVDDFGRDDRFLVFGATAVAEGVQSCLSVPVALDGETIGGLNLYGDAQDAYSPASVAEAEDVAGQMRQFVASARAYQRSLKLVEQIQVTIASRSEIEQAKGILMARSNCDAERAFDILRRASQRQNVKLRQIAHTIVVNTAAGVTSISPQDEP